MKILYLTFFSLWLMCSLVNAKINVVGNLFLTTATSDISVVANEVSHINLNYLDVDEKYHLIQPQAQQKSFIDNLSLVQDLQKSNSNLKVYITVGSEVSAFFSLVVDNPNNRAEFIESVKNVLLLSKTDGININWQDLENKKDRINAILLLKELHDSLVTFGIAQNKNYEISYNVSLESIKKYPEDWSKILYYANYINLIVNDNVGLHENTVAVNSLLSTDGSMQNSMNNVLQLLKNNNIPVSKLVLFFKLEGIKYENVPNEILQFYLESTNTTLNYDFGSNDIQKSIITYAKVKQGYLHNDNYVLLPNFNKASLLISENQRTIIAYIGERFLSHFANFINAEGVYGIGIDNLENQEETQIITDLKDLQGMGTNTVNKNLEDEEPPYESNLERALHQLNAQQESTTPNK